MPVCARATLPSATGSRHTPFRSSVRCARAHSAANHSTVCHVSDTQLAASVGSPYASLELPGYPVTTNERLTDTEPCSSYDFVVVGSGIAGLTYALKVAQYGSVAVITKADVAEGCTVYAQGGVCAVLDPLDSVKQHAADTLVAGNFLNEEAAVDVVCSEGAERVLELVNLGAEFTRDASGGLHLTKEGGHCARRIVHAADATGREISRTLVTAVRTHPNIDILEHHICLDLVVREVDGVRHCLGVDVLDVAANRVERFVALSTMLASGGAGELYPSTTNPTVATGDGIAMAWRANVPVANMEFIQFHPTSLYDPTNPGRAFLITEAVRGEGGLLYNLAGERFMLKYDSRAELAPRDVVARAISDQCATRGDPYVLLDISHKPAEELLAHFPTVAQKCLELGIDITCQPIPVIPAQHYLCGGVKTGLLGETALAGLYACGEVTYTGLHGANRLASNSLLEGLVFAARAVKPALAHAEHALKDCAEELHEASLSAPRFHHVRARSNVAAWAKTTRTKVQQIMWQSAGIERDEAGLLDGLNQLKMVSIEIEALYASNTVSQELIELRNLVTCGMLVLEGGLARQESRGLHYRTDYPGTSSQFAEPTVMRKGEEERKPGVVTVGVPPSSKLDLDQRLWQMCA